MWNHTDGNCEPNMVGWGRQRMVMAMAGPDWDGRTPPWGDERRGGPKGRGRRGGWEQGGRGPGPGPGRGFGGGRGGRGGPGGWGPGGWGPEGGPGKARRGDTRDAVLILLLEGPRHGYQLMTDIADRSAGRWTPSPGSVYPVVRTLAEAGLVDVDQTDGRRTVSLTEDGRTVAERRKEAGPAPWERFAESEQASGQSLQHSTFELVAALRRVAGSAPESALTDLVARVDELRRDAYLILANLDPSAADTGDGEAVNEDGVEAAGADDSSETNGDKG